MSDIAIDSSTVEVTNEQSVVPASANGITANGSDEGAAADVVEDSERSDLITPDTPATTDKKRRRSAPEPSNTESASSSRPQRNRKPPETLISLATAPSRVKAHFNFEQGKGTALADIPNIEHRVSLTVSTSPLLRHLHSVLFPSHGRVTKDVVKKHIRLFSGYPNDEEAEKARLKCEKLEGRELKEIASLLDLSASGTKADVIDRVLDFLESPHATGKHFHSKRKSTSKKSGKSGDKPKRPPNAYFLYLADMRDEVKKAHPTFTVKELSSTIGEMYRSLSEKAKAVYLDKAAELKKAYQSGSAATTKKRKATDGEEDDGDADTDDEDEEEGEEDEDGGEEEEDEEEESAPKKKRKVNVTKSSSGGDDEDGLSSEEDKTLYDRLRTAIDSIPHVELSSLSTNKVLQRLKEDANIGAAAVDRLKKHIRKYLGDVITRIQSATTSDTPASSDHREEEMKTEADTSSSGAAVPPANDSAMETDTEQTATTTTSTTTIETV